MGAFTTSSATATKTIHYNIKCTSARALMMVHLGEGTKIAASVFVTTCTDYNMKQNNNLTPTSSS